MQQRRVLHLTQELVTGLRPADGRSPELDRLMEHLRTVPPAEACAYLAALPDFGRGDR